MNSDDLRYEQLAERLDVEAAKDYVSLFSMCEAGSQPTNDQLSRALKLIDRLLDVPKKRQTDKKIFCAHGTAMLRIAANSLDVTHAADVFAARSEAEAVGMLTMSFRKKHSDREIAAFAFDVEQRIKLAQAEMTKE